jgi:hypothetical protein
MIAVLLSALALAASSADAPAPPSPPVQAPAGPPHERPIIESQLAKSRPAAAATLSGVEADRLYSLYLSRIGQAPQDVSTSPSSGAIGAGESPSR